MIESIAPPAPKKSTMNAAAPPLVPPPPPPPPSLGVPPPSLSGPLPPPPPQVHHGMPMQQPPRAPPSNTVLLVQIPSFLRKHLRLWVHGCGSIRSVVFFPKEEGETSESSHSNNNNNMTDQEQTHKKESVSAALVIMSHAEGAIKLICAVRHIATSLPPELQAYLVPVAPDIPLPPPVLDEDTARTLGERLLQTYHELEVGVIHDDYLDDPYHHNSNNMDTSAANAGSSDGTKGAGVTTTGGGDDDDPLSAPEVLEAVREFRKRLEQTQSVQKRRRVNLVQERIQQLLPTMRQRMEHEMEQHHHHQQQQAMFPPPGAFPPPPPPPPPLPMQPPGFLPPPPPSEPAGPRGVSNLPAWMTNNNNNNLPPEESGGLPPPPLPPQPGVALPPPPPGFDTGPNSDLDRPPPFKRIKVEEEGQAPSTFAGMVAPSQYPVVREWIASMIKEYLGEEEMTLIDFIHQHVIEGKSVQELHEELKVVLDEDATAFCERLLMKLQQQQQ